nr:MAG TPA: Replication associated protein [Microviridae sp.]
MTLCTSPLKGFIKGFTESGKKDLLIVPYTVDHVDIDSFGKRYYRTDNYHAYKDSLDEWIPIPCGQCVECRLQRSRQWADRCMLEMQYHRESYFITLTYDDDHLPKNEIIDEDSGEIISVSTLVKKDLSAFIKRVRRYQEYDGFYQPIRFYGCGEYGSETLRPHFHVILFGLHLPKDGFRLYRQNFNGDNLYNHDFLDRCWKNGYSVVGEVTWQSCAYVARYIMKKQLGKGASDFYSDRGISPEFTLMSRRPGIAREYYDEHKDELFTQDFVHVSTHQGSRRIYPPRYFEKLFDVDYPSDLVDARREKRKQDSIMSSDLELSKTSLDYLDYLNVKDYNLKCKVESLKRPDV